MNDRITQTQAALALAETWESDAETYERYDPNDPKARVLRRCAETLRRLTDETAAEWISIQELRLRTGWSIPYLRTRLQELAGEGKARKRASWQIRRDAAEAFPLKPDRAPDLGGAEDIEEMARILGRSA